MEAGLIGLGGMGTGMAKSLLRAGHSLTVYNRTRSRADALAPLGARVATSVAEASRPGVALTMLADDPALEAMTFGPDGILASLPRGGVHVSCSTISVALGDKLTAEHARAGQHFLSAPVFGRPEAAENSRLAVAVAGEAAIIDRCMPLFEAFGAKVQILGDKPSLANVLKLSGNFLIATVLESLGEAVAFASKSGLDPAVLIDFLTSTLFNAPVYKIYGGLIVQSQYDNVGFALPLGLKDVRLVLQAAEKLGVPLPIASLLRDRFLTAAARGHEHQDWSVIAQLAAEDAGLQPAARKTSA